MFGSGTFTLLLIYTIMGPTIFFVTISIALAFIASFAITAYRAELSDKSLTQDLALIKNVFNTTAILASTPTHRDVVSYYTRTTDTDYKLLELFVGPGLHTRLCTAHPILSHTGNARQVMYVLNALAGVHAVKKAAAEGDNRTKVLELGFGRGYCTLMLAGLLPPTEFEFHGIDIVQRHVDVARRDGAKYPNVYFHYGDAVLSSSYRLLSTPVTTFDIIFAVESLCHVSNVHNLLSNAAKYLSPGGLIVIIDGFRSETFTESPPDQQLAMRLAERAFNIQTMHPMSEWIEAAYPAGLELKRLDDLTTQALPFWTLGWRFAHALLRHAPAWVIRRLRATPYTARSTDNLLAVATVAHAMRNRASALYGVMVFAKRAGGVTEI